MNRNMRLPATVNASIVFLMTTASAYAADGDASIAGTIFLGFLALVLLVQLIPAVMTLYGMLKGIKKPQEKPYRVRSN